MKDESRKEIIAIIPARKGSKRLSQKNIKKLGELSLVEHSIIFSQNHPLITKTIVTSDDSSVWDVCKDYDVIVHKRPAVFCTDTSTTLEVLECVVDEYLLQDVTLVLLQPTSPVRNPTTLTKMLETFERKDESVVTVEKIGNPRRGVVTEESYTPVNYEIGDRSQDIQSEYRENGNLYVISSETIRTKRLCKKNFLCYEIFGNEVIEIDTPEDFAHAQSVFNKTSVHIEPIAATPTRTIGLDEPCFIIAEACDNHLGKMVHALEMVDTALAAGADAIKFQHHLPDEEMLRDVPMSDNFDEPLYEILQKYSLTLEDHINLKAYCDSVGIIYMCTPFSKKAADEINDLVSIFKIGSGEATDIPTLLAIARKNKPMIISTGMTTLEEIEETLKAVRAVNKDIMIMNCTSEYPPDYSHINVGLIKKMQDKFSIIVGHSDHTPDNYTCFAAVSAGAAIIEKHIILDLAMPGPDQNVSIDPAGLCDLVAGIRKIEKAMGSEKHIHDLEKPIMQWARRSIVTIRDIKQGDILSYDNIWCKRPGTGIPSKEIFEVVGAIATNDISKDSLLSYADFSLVERNNKQ